MSRKFYYRSIVEHFLGENYHRHPRLSCDNLVNIHTMLSYSSINVLAFLVSLQHLLENTNLNNNELAVTSRLRDLIASTMKHTIGSKVSSFTELWLERSIDTLPNFKEELLQVCARNLIFPLVQMVHSYLRGERFHIGMPVELFDIQHPNARWRVAVIRRIESITASGEVFFYLNYVGWSNQFDELIPAQSHRIKPMYDKQGEIVYNCEFYSSTDLHLGQPVDYYDASDSQIRDRVSRRWRQGKVSRILSDGVEVADETNETEIIWCRCVTTCKTFTY